MYKPRQVVRGAGNDLEVEDTVTITCPFCEEDWHQQGRPVTWRPSRSCSITRTRVGLLYHCFRASCPRGSGFIPTVYVDTDEAKKEKTFTPKEYPYETTYPTADELSFLEREFEFDEDTVHSFGIKVNPERGTYVFPIRDWRGFDVGVVDRDFTGRRDLKAITYWFNDVVKLYFTPVQGDRCIIVEDIPSAIKASRFVPAVALLSSHLNDKQANLLRSLYSTVIFALDNDATNKSVKLASRYRLYFDRVAVLPLQKDIKDTSYKELENIL